MTSLCTVFGALPLLLATGAGAESRSSIGAVVVYGVAFSMVLTLIVVPAVYVLIAKNSHSPEYVAHLIESMRAKKPTAVPEPGDAH
jgi:multidrug efflux pump